jgi:quinolinate synthase
MAETAKILSPDSIVLHPEPEAGCLMADMADPAEVAAYKKAHPETLLIAYVNTTAATKKEVDLCCTSGNAEKIISKLPANQEIMFLPDSNLGKNVSGTLDRPMQYWGGCCPIHDRITVADVEKARAAHPGALVLVHPECRPEVVAAADEALSTGGMLKFVQESAATDFIIGTECGIMHRLGKENPGKNFYTLDPVPVCEDMKKITLEKIATVLRDMSCRVELDADTIAQARRPIEKMLELSAL